MDDKTIRKILFPFYLALGSISIYLCISFVGILVFFSISESYPLQPVASDATEYWIGFIITLSAGILLILTYHGFIHSSAYPRFTGLFGCGVLISSFIYYTSVYLTVWGEDFWFAASLNIFAKLGQAVLSIASIFLFVATLIYWKKLA